MGLSPETVARVAPVLGRMVDQRRARLAAEAKSAPEASATATRVSTSSGRPAKGEAA